MAEKADDLKTREEKIAQAKELYSRGSRNYLVKSYNEAADDLSQVCCLYEELYGTLADELGMPYLLYAKSLLALEENKIIDVPDEEDDDDDDDEEPAINEENCENQSSTAKVSLPTIIESDEKLTENIPEKDVASTEGDKGNKKNKELNKEDTENPDDSSSSIEKDERVKNQTENQESKKEPKDSDDHAKPGTSNGNTVEGGEEEDDTNDEVEDGNEPATNLQVAWETLELAGKIFERQGEPALSNFAEVKTELGNIQFENNILDAARDDFNDALKIYKELPSNYRRAMAEIHYKIGLTYLMQEQQSSKESVESLKQACELLDEEIKEFKSKPDQSECKVIIEDMEETRKEIWIKITEIEESRQQCLAEVRAALDSYISPSKDSDIAGPSTSSSSLRAADKPANDISHLIKRKKPENTNDTEASPAKRPAL